MVALEKRRHASSEGAKENALSDPAPFFVVSVITTDRTVVVIESTKKGAGELAFSAPFAPDA